MKNIKNKLFSKEPVTIGPESGYDNYIMAIESSCDETACSIVKNGREVKPSVAATSPVRQSQPKPQLKQSPVMKPIEKTSEVEADEVEELKEEVAKPVKTDAASKIEASLHSDNVNMVMELFDGKVID